MALCLNSGADGWYGWCIIGFKSAEEIQVEVLIFSRRSRLWLLLLWLFLLLGLLLLLDLLLLFLGRGACRSTNRNLRESLADDLNNIASTSSTFLLLSDLRTASTWASSTGLPVALRMAITESLAEWDGCYLGLFLRDRRGQLLRRTASLMVNIKYYNLQLLIIYCCRVLSLLGVSLVIELWTCDHLTFI